MKKVKPSVKSPREWQLSKCPTGIRGIDEITVGGLPRGRPTLVCGGAGSGKSLFGIEFLVRGAVQYGEPGVCVSFEETVDDIADNAASLGFDLKGLTNAGRLVFDYIHIDKSQISETGDYDLEALFIRIGSAIDSIGAKRVLIDTPEALFAGLTDQGLLRSELQRLFRWLKEKGVTAVITGEQGPGTITRHSLEEYVSDCVIVLDQRVQDGIVTRRLRVVKYRGSTHGANEYPFLIDRDGISVLPVTSIGLRHESPLDRISTGIPGLDAMLGGQGFFRGSSILATGAAGTGKSSLAAHFADATCRRGEVCLLFSLEESPLQLFRNMSSIGLDLKRWSKKGLLHIHSARPTLYGLEMHLLQMHKLMQTYKPSVVIVDPISSLVAGGPERDVRIMLLRMIDHLKLSGTTAFLTALTRGERPVEATELEVSSLIDTWILARSVEVAGERNRLLSILKSRGMAHSNQVREFVITDNGVKLQDVYLGPGGMLTGSARLAQEAHDREAELLAKQKLDRRQKEWTHRRRSLEAQIIALQAEQEAERQEFKTVESEADLQRKASADQRRAMAKSRHTDIPPDSSSSDRRRGKG